MSSSVSTPPMPPDSPSAILPETRATPSYGAGGSFTVACSTHIAAPPAVCAETILRHADYPSWNRFCRSVTVDAPGPAPTASDAPGANAPDFVKGGPEFLAPETQFTFDVHMDSLNKDSGGRATGIVVSFVERIDEGGRKGWRVAWKARGTPGFVMRSERVQEFVEVEGGQTEYSCWETFYGALAPVIRLMVGGQLVTCFGVWMEDLKAQAEKKANGGA